MSEVQSMLAPEQAEALKAMEQDMLAAAEEITASHAEQAAPAQPESTPKPQEIIETESGNTLKVTETVLRTKRAEGAPEDSQHDGVIEVGEPSVVESAAGTPVVTTRQRGGAYRPQGPTTSTVSAPGVMGGRFDEVQQTEYKNGVKHVYGVDENGKKQHLSFDSILEAYGHAGDMQGKRPTEVPSTEESPQEDEPSTSETQPTYAELNELQHRTLALYEQALADGENDIAAQHMVELRRLDDEINALLGGVPASGAGEAAPTTNGEAVEAASPEEEPSDVEAVAAVAEEAQEPVSDPSPQGMKARASRIWSRVKESALRRAILTQNGATQAVANRLSTEEQSERSKRRGIYAGLAAGALILGTYIAHKQGVIDLPFIPGPKGGDTGGNTATSDALDSLLTDPLNTGGDGKEFDFAKEVMNVRPGEGFEDSLQQQYGLSDAQSHQLFEQLKPELKGADGTYMQAGDIRISNPGAFHYDEEQRQIIEKFLKNKAS